MRALPGGGRFSGLRYSVDLTLHSPLKSQGDRTRAERFRASILGLERWVIEPIHRFRE